MFTAALLIRTLSRKFGGAQIPKGSSLHHTRNLDFSPGTVGSHRGLKYGEGHVTICALGGLFQQSRKSRAGETPQLVK